MVEIETKKLYVPHSTLAEYASFRWDFSPSDTSRFKAAAKVLEILDGFDTLPTNEGQARQLAKLKDKPEVLKKVWDDVVSSGEKITAATIRTQALRHHNASVEGIEPQIDEEEETLENAQAEIQIGKPERKASRSPVDAAVLVVRSYQTLDEELGDGDGLDDETWDQIAEQFELIRELESRIREKLNLVFVE